MFLFTVREHFVVNLITFKLNVFLTLYKKLYFDSIKSFMYFPLDFVKRFITTSFPWY